MTTGMGMLLTDGGASNTLTSGGMLKVLSNSSDTTARNLVFVHNDNTAATGATNLRLTNDSTGPVITSTTGATSTNYFKFATANGVTIWIGNGTTGQGNLSGTAGDMLINGGSSKIEFCTGTTNWTATT